MTAAMEDTQGQREGARHSILIVDDHALIRQALHQLITRQLDLEVGGEAVDLVGSLALVESEQPDLAIVDLVLKDAHGLELIPQIKSRSPSTRILVLSMHDEKLYAERCLRAGAQGYVQKRDAVDRVLEGIRTVLGGQIYVSESVSEEILSRIVQKKAAEGAEVERLSNRELQLLELLAEGLTAKEMAEQLDLSVKTIHTYREKLKSKLGLDNIYQLIRYAVAWKLRRT
ncbi:MAG: response regulator transcription factor [Gemmatimonadetes bacterium]|uniref:Response regulator transcription factor n=1 Tax=Candidatus Kutchimonas denitrificans TaxID=3056748 RepID=A0AAE4Z5P6_9BACT|nr:response regulator transcription factor [Gemmatimonadota bacterium]NIR74285.1 response regulator transcription factor [Candidatus Kutchimonas denitrificans]NIS02540.1 response regulator transcription factor [Gemmatimonadota bacterium]NIT68416.1 response regulator transcription factor [Gemmatimonadota bacterium]NIU51868.1 response regulator [Gemmatimonadota bacterium]